MGDKIKKYKKSKSGKELILEVTDTIEEGRWTRVTVLALIAEAQTKLTELNEYLSEMDKLDIP